MYTLIASILQKVRSNSHVPPETLLPRRNVLCKELRCHSRKIKNARILCYKHSDILETAGATGFEPVSTVLETAALPLNYAPIRQLVRFLCTSQTKAHSIFIAQEQSCVNPKFICRRKKHCSTKRHWAHLIIPPEITEYKPLPPVHFLRQAFDKPDIDCRRLPPLFLRDHMVAEPRLLHRF